MVRVAKIIDVEEKQDLGAQIVEEIQEDSLGHRRPSPSRQLSLLNSNGKADDSKSFRRSIGYKNAGTVSDENNDSNAQRNIKTLMGSLKKLHRIRRGYPERFLRQYKSLFIVFSLSVAELLTMIRIKY